jgi:hypothetical protein
MRVLAGDHCHEHRYAGAESIADIYLFATLGANASKILTGLCRDIENQSVRGSARPAPPELARGRHDLYTPLRRLDISRPDIEHKILGAGDVNRSLMVSKAEVTSSDLITAGRTC